MLTQRFNELLTEVCRVNTGEFARVGRYDRSYVSHLRNGDRVPRPGFGASERLEEQYDFDRHTIQEMLRRYL